MIDRWVHFFSFFSLKWLYTTWSLAAALTPHKGFPSNIPWSLDAFRLTAIIIDPLAPVPCPPLLASSTVFPYQWCGARGLSGLRLEQLSPAQRTLLIGSPGAVPSVEQSRAVTVEACRSEQEPMQAYFKTHWTSLWDPLQFFTIHLTIRGENNFIRFKGSAMSLCIDNAISFTDFTDAFVIVKGDLTVVLHSAWDYQTLRCCQPKTAMAYSVLCFFCHWNIIMTQY